MGGGPGGGGPEPVWDYAYTVVDTPEKLADFVQALKAQAKFCLDTETTALEPLKADLVGLSFSWKEGEAYYIPVRAPMGEMSLDPAVVLDALRPILEDPGT